MTIKERHNQLNATIGFLESETESLERAQLFAWVFFPTWIFMAILQAISFMLYDGIFHPLVKILDGCKVEESNEIYFSPILGIFNLLNHHTGKLNVIKIKIL